MVAPFQHPVRIVFLGRNRKSHLSHPLWSRQLVAHRGKAQNNVFKNNRPNNLGATREFKVICPAPIRCLIPSMSLVTCLLVGIQELDMCDAHTCPQIPGTVGLCWRNLCSVVAHFGSQTPWEMTHKNFINIIMYKIIHVSSQESTQLILVLIRIWKCILCCKIRII